MDDANKCRTTFQTLQCSKSITSQGVNSESNTSSCPNIDSRYAPESSFREDSISGLRATNFNQIINTEPVESPILAKGVNKFTYLFVEL